MRQEILDAAARRNVFLSPEAMEVILSNGEPMALTHTVLTALSSNVMFVTKQDVLDCLVGDKPVFECEKPITPHNKRCSEIRVIPETDVTGQSLCEGTIEDFTKYFQSRFNTLKRIIERRRDFGVALSIERARSLDRESKIIGIVNEKNMTKNGHMMINVEDETGRWKVLVQKDSPLINETIVNDSVIGISGKPTSSHDLFIADAIYHPDVPSGNKWVPSDSTARIAFLSDVHIGSHTFLESNWKKMIEWLKHNSDDLNLQYIVLPGDVVDGIGVFPDQEKELDVTDIYDQYNMLSEYLKDVPDHIKMVIHPGNHDAARPAEPQPALNTVFTKTFDSNIIMTANPVYLEVEGRKILSYHGKSIDDWIAGVQKLKYEDPLAVMKEMAINRHLAPIYGQRTALAPEKKDFMAMEVVPDIFVSGHVHGAGTMEYHGIKMINASTWQSQTGYQKSHNFNPDPGIMPIVHLGTGRIDMKSFM